MASGKSKKRYTNDGKLIQHTTIKVRLHPTLTQAALFDQTFGCCRYIWNRMLADEMEFYAATGEHFIPTPARYKKEAPFLKEVDSQALAAVHQNLRRAFQKFFSKPQNYRFPVFKKKKSCKNSYTVYKIGTENNIYLTENCIRLPKLGLVRATFHRRPLHWWRLKSATVSKAPTGKYFCSLLFEYAARVPEGVPPTPDKTLGLNYSVPHFYVDSEGRRADPPHWLARSEKRLAEMQRKLARMERDSRNYKEQLHRIQLLHEHIANQRKDFIHKESRRIANAYDAVCVRTTDLSELSQTLKLGNVLDSGFGKFQICLEYKLEKQGKRVIKVDRYYPSAKTCPVCGSVNDELTMRDRIWACPVCGASIVRDVNAARNIKAQGLAQCEIEISA